ncbi:hypothetical protein PROFUN_00941 [Planoprotostelium fungivorum]|uniref:Hemerythrin-like domain-containing protein n=1 Tax=Planoprotostelium fungivorum TaxID=1890364 RepID=A0A2P6N487_9EUKA|nr:hypothetical protein PROFUN_00941 [Planoprotostelium fungivorum]
MPRGCPWNGLQDMMMYYHNHFRSNTEKLYNIEEQHIFPILARKMPKFAKDHIDEHKHMNESLSQMRQYVEQGYTDNSNYHPEEMKKRLDALKTALFDHLSAEEKSLGEEEMKKYWTEEEMEELVRSSEAVVILCLLCYTLFSVYVAEQVSWIAALHRQCLLRINAAKSATAAVSFTLSAGSLFDQKSAVIHLCQWPADDSNNKTKETHQLRVLIENDPVLGHRFKRFHCLRSTRYWWKRSHHNDHFFFCLIMRQHGLLLCILLGLSVTHATIMSWRNTYGCYADGGGNIAFNTSYCWDSGVVPSAGDTAIISLGTNSYGIEIFTNISLSQLIINGSVVTISASGTNITSITLVNGAQLAYDTDSSASSSISLSGGSDLTPLKNSLSVRQLTFSDASLTIAMHDTFDLYCRSVGVQNGGMNVYSSTKELTHLTWHFDSMYINGNIVDSASISHSYQPISSSAIFAMSNSSTSPLTLWNTGSSITFNSTNVTVQSPVTWLANSITFSPNSTLTLNSTSSNLASIDASSAYVTLSSVSVNVADINPYYQNRRLLIQASDLRSTQPIKVSQNTSIPQKCQGPSNIDVQNQQKMVLSIDAYVPSPVTDLEFISRGQRNYYYNFRRVADPCETYYFYNDNGTFQSDVLVKYMPTAGRAGPFEIRIPVLLGEHNYWLNYTYVTKDGRSYNAKSNTVSFDCNGSNAVVSVGVLLIVFAIFLVS